jgi:hypothetical protein
MKRTLKYALLASTTAFVLGVAVPSQAQQDYMQAGRATSPQRVYQPYGADRYWAGRTYGAATRGYGAYAYGPGGLGYNAYAYAPEGVGYNAYAYAPEGIGYDAYAYAPQGYSFGGGGCVTEGGYGKGLDYSFCGGGGGD